MESNIERLHTDAPRKKKALTINSKLLLSLYVVVPALLVIALTDYWFFDAALREKFIPAVPSQWAYWTVLFNLPHIIASWVTFADKEYLRHYRREFSFYLPITVLLVFVVHQLVGGSLAFIILGFYTMYHVLSQQFGISLFLMDVKPTADYEWWRWLSSVGAMAIYAIVFNIDTIRQTEFAGLTYSEWCLLFAGVCLGLSLVFSERIRRRAKYKCGVVYMQANVIMLFACFVVAKLEYFAFVIMMPRIVHDITAFVVYATHDQNRNRNVTVNYIYKALSFTKLPFFMLSPLIAISIAYPLTNSSYNKGIELIIFSLTYFHYFSHVFDSSYSATD